MLHQTEVFSTDLKAAMRFEPPSCVNSYKPKQFQIPISYSWPLDDTRAETHHTS